MLLPGRGHQALGLGALGLVALGPWAGGGGRFPGSPVERGPADRNLERFHHIDAMTPLSEYVRYETRRQFFAKGKNVLGFAALSTLMQRAGMAGADASDSAAAMRAVNHFAPKAKRVIYLHMVGGPSQMDLYDYKPGMKAFYDKDLPESIRNGQRLTGMTSGQSRFPIAPSSTASRGCG